MATIEETGARRNQDLVLTMNEYAHITDETKGEVSIYVGPNKASLAGSDRPSLFDKKSNRFKGVSLEAAIQAFQLAEEGAYIVLENPADDEKNKHPAGTGKITSPRLQTGKKVNIPGPASFALWPGQNAKMLQGHNLRSNEFVLARVYDEEAAKANHSKAVIKTQTDVGSETTTDPVKPGAKAKTVAGESRTPSDIPSEKELTMGKLFVIRGTEVSFYIPPTGIEVVPEHVNGEDRYVREAVTLERLEYCLLLDQNGNKRYVRGPAVVFPRPTEKFVEAPIKSNPEKAKAKKFRAQELTPTSGIHIRVIADYTEDDGTHRKEGQELFVTGAEQPVYFPREEHAIIKYGEQDVHYGIAIPSGETRYVLDRNSGVISVETGPKVFLPDPRSQVIAQRALPLSLCSLLYPGNEEALTINAARLGLDEQDIMGVGGANAAFLNSSYTRGVEDENYGAVAAVATPDGGRGRILIRAASKSLPGEAFDRKNKFTAPRSVILNTKYDGAVQTTLWTGYAMLLVSKSGKVGERRVIQGPGTYTLEYDESPQVLTLSRGKPKNMDNPLKTVFLQTTANMVSDIVEVETKDFCRLNVKLSYRVSFEGDPNAWFNVDNYVKFLCDHMRSRIRSAVQKLGIEKFYGEHTDLLRDIVLGTSVPAKGDKEGAKASRPGTAFTENGMRIYDVEVLGVEMQNPEVEKMLVSAQREVIQNTLVLAGERRKLVYVKEAEELKRETEVARAETQKATYELQALNAKRKMDLDMTIIQANAQTQMTQALKELEATEARTKISLAQEQATVAASQIQFEQESKEREANLAHDAKAQELKLKEITANVAAVVEKSKAISPDLVAALSSFGERAMVEKVAEAMAPLSILSGGKKSVLEILQELLKGTTLSNQLQSVIDKPNGAAKALSARG